MRMPDFDSNDDKPERSKDTSLSEQLRLMWIDEVRRYHRKSTGRVSNYVPGPRLDGGRDAHGSLFQPMWPKLAKFVVDNKLDPVRFIKSQFLQGKPPASPAMLLGTRAVKRYHQSIDTKELEKEIALSRDIQLRQAKTALEYYSRLYHYDTKLSYRGMLLDDTLSMSALFRYCVAKLIGEEDIASIYLSPAAMIYIGGTTIYDATYNGWITDELRQAAVDIDALYAIAGGKPNGVE